MSLELVLLVAAAVVAVFGYVLFVRIRMREKDDAFNRNEKNDDRRQQKQSGPGGEPAAAAASGAAGKPSRKTAASNAATTVKKQRTTDANYQHPWLYTTLKGHTGQVFDMDFSRNGKYLATCAEDSPSAQSSSGNHLINGNINENDEQNATTRSLSPASSSASSSAFSVSVVNDGKVTNSDTIRCSGSSSGINSSGLSNSSGGSSSSSSSGGSTRGEELPNGQGASKKQRRYTKKKQQYKKSSAGNGGNSNNNSNSKTQNTQRPSSPSSATASDDSTNTLQEDHLAQTNYYYGSALSPPSSPSRKVISSLAGGSNGQPVSNGSALPPASSLSSSSSPSQTSAIKMNKTTSYQGRLDFSGRTGNVQQRHDKKHNQVGNTGVGHANSSVTANAATAAGPTKHAVNTSPLRQYVKLNLSENDLVKYLRKYVLDKDVMKQLGFPVEYGLDMDKAIIYKFSHDFFRPAAQFYPPAGEEKKRAHHERLVASDKSDDNDSGQGSGTSSPTNVDDNDALLMYRLSSKSTSLQSPLGDMQLQPSEERECCRCGKGFFTTLDGEYLTQEHCIYHWGRLTRVYSGSEFKKVFSCCNGDSDVKGCTINKLHVWTGLLSGFNGPFDGFVKTEPSPRKLKKFEKLLLNKFYYQDMNVDCLELQPEDTLDDDENDGIYALDCEMSYTGRGLELTKVTVVAVDGSLVYERLVKPDIEIVDYNTRYSGVTEADFSDPRNYATLRQVQKDLLKFIYDDTILIGHSIENDLKVLKFIHKTVIDTSITFPHMNGFPFRQSLKALTKSILKRDIQMQSQGGSIVAQSHLIHQKQQHHHHINAELAECESSTSSTSLSSSNSSSNSRSSSSSNSASSNSSNSIGHCSLEDSRASLELMLWRVRKDKAAYDNIWSNNISCYRMQN
ncbi:uncharacterized protein LOC134205448 isoform X2 [Armigeres subalbatus]|uniref:uncharacterized protein LOC134205448 isoform X2 n=1 Tax=Armigeres subalbatus TaxID=124917 RepID=UPI002ED3A8E5